MIEFDKFFKLFCAFALIQDGFNKEMMQPAKLMYAEFVSSDKSQQEEFMKVLRDASSNFVEEVTEILEETDD